MTKYTEEQIERWSRWLEELNLQSADVRGMVSEFLFHYLPQAEFEYKVARFQWGELLIYLPHLDKRRNFETVHLAPLDGKTLAIRPIDMTLLNDVEQGIMGLCAGKVAERFDYLVFRKTPKGRNAYEVYMFKPKFKGA